MGLNGREPELGCPLAERIAQAVAEAVAAGDQSRKDVFAQFADQPKTVVYRHIARVLETTGAKLAPTKLLSQRSRAMTEAEEDAEIAAVMPTVEEIERLAAGGKVGAVEPLSHHAAPAPAEPVLAAEPVNPVAEQPQTPRHAAPAPPEPPESVLEDLEPADDASSGQAELSPSRRAVEPARPGPGRALVVNGDGEVTVDVAAGMVHALAQASALMELAKHADGSGIRNARLMVVAIDLFGKTCERKARMDADLSDSSQQGAYLRAITDAVLAEPADVKARILARMKFSPVGDVSQ
jgi:hypothetical protein